MNNKSRRWLIFVPAVVLATIALAGLVLARTALPDNRVLAGDEAAAAQVLGRPLPEPQFLPLGVRRSGIGVDPTNTPTGPRRVTVSYAISGRNVALMSLTPGGMGRAEGAQTTIGGFTAFVSVRAISDGSTDVQYVWDRDGLGYNLHVNLVSGLTRDLADRMAQSVR